VTARQISLTSAARKTILARRRDRGLPSVDALAEAHVLFIADRLDHLDPDTDPAQVASLFRTALAARRDLLEDDAASDDGGLSEVLALLATAPTGPMGDAPLPVPPWPDGGD
jgi:hypothetical protein